ncbi:hypothetical protein PanWU01x14_153120, partial [Parasponia andersonii]
RINALLICNNAICNFCYTLFTILVFTSLINWHKFLSDDPSLAKAIRNVCLAFITSILNSSADFPFIRRLIFSATSNLVNGFLSQRLAPILQSSTTNFLLVN